VKIVTAALLIYSKFIIGAHADESPCVDVTIVLAVDGSGSISTEEFDLQRRAIIAALRSTDVLQAMSRAGTVLAAVMYWGDAEWPTQETPFVKIESPNDIDQLISEVEKMPRRVLGSTGLSMALNASLDKIVGIECTHRSIINVSGDGRDTDIPRRRRAVPSIKDVKTRAEALGVTINALVISSDEPYLKSYFEKQVIVGQDAFVMEILNLSDFEEAIRRKLVREISPATLSER
jgi:hypothetical protein